jgi:uncharacterized protein (DUF58 family)
MKDGRTPDPIREASPRSEDEAARNSQAIPEPPPSLVGLSLFDEGSSLRPTERRPRGARAKDVTSDTPPEEERKPAPPPEPPAKQPRLRGSRRLKMTREGKYYLGITLGVGFAAINTGNNLLYLLLGMLLSLIVISGVMSELSLRKLTVTRRLPLRAQVGRPHLVEIEVYNHKGRVPSYAIEVEDLRAGQPADKRCFFLKISPSSAQVAAYRRTPAKRGLDHHTGFRIATRFPFGLFEKSREVIATGELVIYPAVDPVRLPVEGGLRHGFSGRASGRGGGEETYAVRPMREGDDPRDIYWRKSAGMPQVVLRERLRETRPDVELTLDVVHPGEKTLDFTNVFERKIREIASRAVAHLRRGDSVVVRTTAGQRVTADKTVGADRVLRFLALVDGVSDAEARAQLAKRRRSGAPPAVAAVELGARPAPLRGPL